MTRQEVKKLYRETFLLNVERETAPDANIWSLQKAKQLKKAAWGVLAGLGLHAVESGAAFVVLGLSAVAVHSA